MVLLVEDPASLISSTMKSFSLKDAEVLTSINSSVAEIQKARASRVAESEAAIRALQRSLAHARDEVDTNAKLHAKKEHGNKMYALDKQKFALAKAINERESRTHELENEKARLEEELAELEEEERRGDVYGQADDTVLKLKLYRSMGIELKEDEAGGYSQAMIQNKQAGDIHVINIEKKYTSHFYSNYFWDMI